MVKEYHKLQNSTPVLPSESQQQEVKDQSYLKYMIECVCRYEALLLWRM
jgi:hypothetical protein